MIDSIRRTSKRLKERELHSVLETLVFLYKVPKWSSFAAFRSHLSHSLLLSLMYNIMLLLTAAPGCL